MIKTTLAKLLTVKVATATVAFTALGGVAVAAGTDTLSGKPDDKASTAQGQASGSKGDGSGQRPDQAPSKKDKDADDKSKKATHSPSMVGLCNAYMANDKAEHGKALESTAFTALIKAAGSKSDVPAYCKVVLATKDSKASQDRQAGADGKTDDDATPADTQNDKPRPERGDTTKPEPTRTPAPRVTEN